MPVKIGMVSLGCSKNLVDSERMLYKFRQKGYRLVTEPGLADVVVVNTCAFIQEAKEEVIETIGELSKLKKEGTIKKIIITGCLAERYREEVAENFSCVDAVVGIGSQEDITNIIEGVLKGEKVNAFNSKDKLAITGDRIISTLPFFAYLKIAEGCDNCCSYCVIPKIRGRFRSAPMDDVLKEARWLAENGVTEIIVVAQDTTRYGEDLYGKPMLPELLEKLCEIDNIKWIRVLYCYPERITNRLLEVIASQKKIVKYLDIPIQHCNEKILKNMNRLGSREYLTNLMSKIRKTIPGVVLRTTIITGFPGETEEQYEELAEFVGDVKFDKLGCFVYSQEEETPASGFDGQIDDEIKARRAEIIMQQQQLISERKNAEKTGCELETVVEGYDKYAECYFGRTSADAPDIDGKVFFTSKNRLDIGQYLKIKITETLDYDLIGEVIEQ